MYDNVNLAYRVLLTLLGLHSFLFILVRDEHVQTFRQQEELNVQNVDAAQKRHKSMHWQQSRRTAVRTVC